MKKKVLKAKLNALRNADVKVEKEEKTKEKKKRASKQKEA
jgi:hypothetical protein